MHLFKRITATLNASVSNVVSHIENHDAIVDAALKETHAAAAKARVRLARIRKDGEQIRARLKEAERMETVWTERAVSSAREDEQKALSCISRRNACRAQKQQGMQSLARHEEIEREITASVERIEQRVQQLTQQRNQMRSRHSAADALNVINKIEGGSAWGIEDVFERWEMVITETEYANGAATEPDSLNASFHQEETQEALKADLASLLAAAPTDSHKE